ncbi:unnamed protein product [Effrenium voratum]|uniref:Uncharacterized protein n=1 Tax=Effrenium voratum TaxID=2562239 RepID=A0AA36NNB8_9DINO|nr:unnamed protein product [Effrenium voratum]
MSGFVKEVGEIQDYLAARGASAAGLREQQFAVLLSRLERMRLTPPEAAEALSIMRASSQWTADQMEKFGASLDRCLQHAKPARRQMQQCLNFGPYFSRRTEGFAGDR